MSRWPPRISQIGGQPPPPPEVVDRFAPRYLVGNIPAGDLAVPQGAPFTYIPDAGDGAGIAAALAAAAVVPGDVWIRPGVYDLGAGAVTGPLSVPANVRVYGSGYTTVVRARNSGNQGVFALGDRAQLRDMVVENLSSDASSSGSDALITVSRECVLSNLVVNVTGAPGGQLREGIRFLGFPTIEFSDINNVSVVCNYIDGSSPMRGLSFRPLSFVSGRLVRVSGGDESVYLQSGVFLCKDLIVGGFSSFGVRFVGSGGALRLDEAVISAGPSIPGQVGVSIEGPGGHVLRSVSCQMSGAAGSRGISAVPSPGDQIDRLQIDDCETFNAEIGIQLGSSSGGYVTDCSVVNCSIPFSFGRGIVVENAQSSQCFVRACNVIVIPGTGPVGVAIDVEGSSHNIDGNNITHDDGGTYSQSAIRVSAPYTRVSSNRVRTSSGFGIAVLEESCAVTGNVVTQDAPGASNAILFDVNANSGTCVGNVVVHSPTGLGSAIEIRSDRCTCSANTINVGTTPSATPISISGDNNTVVSNTTTSLPQVTNNGAGNEIGHNVP